MKLNYYFNYKGRDEYYTYEIDNQNIKKHLSKEYTPIEIFEDWSEELLSTTSQEDREFFLLEFGFDLTRESFTTLTKEEQEDLTDMFLDELLELTDRYEEELKDYYESDAYEEFLEQMEAYEGEEDIRRRSYWW